MSKENVRRLDLRVVLGAVALVAVAGAMWAATALAGGSSPSTNAPSVGGEPAGEYVQQESETPRQPGDCPEGEDGDGGDSGLSDATSLDV